jgi:hypothetical protein
MAEYLKLEVGQWTRLPSTNVEVQLHETLVPDGVRQVLITRDGSPGVCGWDLTPVWRLIIVRYHGYRFGKPVDPPQRRNKLATEPGS